MVCFVLNRSSTCNDSNLLFTLKKENAKNPSEVLANLTNYGNGFASPKIVWENGNIPQFIPLQPLVDNTLPKDSGW